MSLSNAVVPSLLLLSQSSAPVVPSLAVKKSAVPKPVSLLGFEPIEPDQSSAAIAVPLSVPGFLTATVLSFAHTLGEFGVVLMVGGNIPGETRVVSIAIYDHVESLDYASAHQMSIILVVFAFVVLLSMFLANRRLERRSR